MRQLRWFVAVALLLGTLGALGLFIVANGGPVRLDLPFVRAFYSPLWVVVLGSFGAGALVASTGLLVQLGKKSLAVRRSEKRVRGLESELAELRTEASAPPAVAAPPEAPSNSVP